VSKEDNQNINKGSKDFLLRLSDTLRSNQNPEDVQFEAVNLLGKHLGVGRAFYCDMDPDGDHMWIRKDYVNNVESQAGYFRISDFGPFLLNEYLAGRTVVTEDAASDTRLSEEERLRYPIVDVSAFVCVPLVKGGKLVSVLAVNQPTPRKWLEAEISIIQETAERTWAAVERAKAEHVLSKTEEQLRAVLEQAPLAIAITGARGDIQFRNTMFDELWGRPAHETEASNYSQVYAGFHLDGKPIESEEWPGAKAILKGEVVIDEILEIVHLSGRKIPCSFNAGPIRNEDGKITGGVVLFHDVTAERTANMQLRKSEEKYRTLFDSIDAGFCILEVLFNENEIPYDYRFLEANNAFEKQTGLIDAVGKTMKEMVHGHEQYWFDIYGRIAKTGKSERFENEAKALGIYYEVFAFPAGEPEENRVGVLFNDITERKQTEEKIRESENRFRIMADASPVLIWTLNANGSSSCYNKTFLDFLGVSMEEDISNWAKIVHPDDLKVTLDTINMAIVERRSYSLECRLLRADGQWRWVLAQGNPNMGADSEFLGFVGSSVDITEQKVAQQKIEESEHRFHQLIFSSPSMIAILRGENFIIEIANDAILEQLGKGKDIIGLPYLKAVPELEEQGFGELLREVYKTGIPHHAHEMPGTLLHNGNEVTDYYNFIYQPQRNIDNEIVGIAIIATTVTPQAEFHLKIKESEQRFQNLVRDTTVGIFVLTGENMEVEIVNEAYSRLIDLKPEDLLGKPLFSVVPDAEGYYRPLLEKVRQTGEPRYLYDSPYSVFVNGNRIEGFLHVVLQPYRDADGTSGVMGIHQDVTETVKSRKKIEESESYFRSLTDTVPAIIWITEPDGSCTYLNKNWYSYTGQTEPEAKGFGWLDATHPDDKEETEKIFLEANAQQKPFIASYRLKVKNGGYRWAIDRGSPKFNEAGVYEGMIGTVMDVHEEELAAEKIRDSEEQFSTLANNIQNLAWMANADGGIFWYNNRWFEYTGTTQAEMEGWGWKSVHDPEQLPLVIERWQQSIHTGEPFEMIFPLKGADNKFRSFLTRVEPMRDEEGKVIRWVGTNTDITEQKETEALLGYSKALLEAHNESSVDGILLVDAKGKILSYNQRFIEIWNMPQEVVDAKDDEAVLSFAKTQLVNPEQFIGTVKYLHEHPTEICLDELNFIDGKIVERNGYSVIGEDGTYYAWSWTYRDITKQKNYENTIIENEQRFRTLAETLPQLVWMTDEKGAFEYASNQWMYYSGLDPHAEDTWEKLVHPQDMENLMRVWAISLQTGETYHAEARLKNKDGAYRWHLVQGEPIKNEKGSIIKWIGAFTDIENLKEEQKQKDDFLSMASHELRTPLTTIKAYSQIIERILEEKDDVQTLGMVKKMNKQVGRLTTLIADLLDVTKMQKGGLIRNESVFNFNHLVAEVIDDMQKTIGTHQIIDRLDTDIKITGDKDKLGQVLNNLLSNAAKYSPNADKIIVSTQVMKDGIQLSVQDFGIGISTAVQKRVFEQFYRVTGDNQSTFQGMGIGLYICAEIIKREGGKIWLESAAGEGSVFYVWLPVGDKK